MNKNTSVSFDSNFDRFIQRSLIQIDYKNSSAAVRAGLLEQEKQKMIALRQAI